MCLEEAERGREVRKRRSGMKINKSDAGAILVTFVTRIREINDLKRRGFGS